MCGVFGYVTHRDEALGPILVEAAQRLTYRGYDSVGAATFRHGTIDLRKDVGKVDEVAARHDFAGMRGTRGIAQLRWATFGAPSQVNAQPHLDSDGAMVGAHNGNVVNNAELRLQFLAEGMTVRSDNDGETCVHAVERYTRRGHELVDAIRLAYGDLQGDYAFVIGRADDDRLYAFKKGSGLVVGIGEGFTCVSSDLPSLLPLTRNVIRPLDGEIVTLWADRVEVRSVEDGGLVDRPVEVVTESMEAVRKGGYAHFMAKEIHEQPQVARELLHLLDASPDVAPLVEQMRQRPAALPGRLWHELPRRLGRLRLPRPARRTCGGPRAGAAVHRPVRTRGWTRGRRDLRQPVGRDQGRAQRPRGGARSGGCPASVWPTWSAPPSPAPPGCACRSAAATRSACRPRRRSPTRS